MHLSVSYLNNDQRKIQENNAHTKNVTIKKLTAFPMSPKIVGNYQLETYLQNNSHYYGNNAIHLFTNNVAYKHCGTFSDSSFHTTSKSQIFGFLLASHTPKEQPKQLQNYVGNKVLSISGILQWFIHPICCPKDKFFTYTLSFLQITFHFKNLLS